MKLSERENWFLDRVGKRVYQTRGFATCKCDACVYEDNQGVVILDKEHAEYLYDMEIDYNTDRFPLSKHPIKYFDSPEERDEFELTLKK